MNDLYYAARYFCGHGIEYGVDFQSAMTVLRSAAVKANYPYKCVLETVVVGGAWPNVRVNEIHPLVFPYANAA